MKRISAIVIFWCGLMQAIMLLAAEDLQKAQDLYPRPINKFVWLLCDNQQEQALSMLDSGDVNINDTDEYGNTVLHKIFSSQQFAIEKTPGKGLVLVGAVFGKEQAMRAIDIALERGVNIIAVNKNQETALHTFARYGVIAQHECVAAKLLEKQPVLSSIQDRYGTIPLLVALNALYFEHYFPGRICQNNHDSWYKKIDFLLNHCTKELIQKKNNEGHDAASKRYKECLSDNLRTKIFFKGL